jgi:hypothetical protein
VPVREELRAVREVVVVALAREVEDRRRERRALRELHVLDQLEVRFVEVVGLVPPGERVEPSILVGIPRDPPVEIGPVHGEVREVEPLRAAVEIEAIRDPRVEPRNRERIGPEVGPGLLPISHALDPRVAPCDHVCVV